MLNPFWNWFSIIVIIASILGCWWLLHWTKGISDRDDESDVHDTGHVWDHNIRELNNPLPRWWLHLFNITIVFALVYLVLYPGLGNVDGVRDWTQEKKYEREMEVARERTAEVLAPYETMEPAALRASSEAMDIGRRLYTNHCSMCHGSDARGGVGFPNLTDDSWQWGEGFDNILYAINNGRVAAMPALGAAWDESQMNSVVAYVRSLSGLEHDASAAAAGQQTFTMLCAACHGPDGKGNPVLGAQNLTDDYWLYGSDRDTLRTTLRQGRNGNMPAHEDLMSETQRRILAAYVSSLSRSGD